MEQPLLLWKNILFPLESVHSFWYLIDGKWTGTIVSVLQFLLMLISQWTLQRINKIYLQKYFCVKGGSIIVSVSFHQYGCNTIPIHNFITCQLYKWRVYLWKIFAYPHLLIEESVTSFNSSPPSAAYIRQWIGSALVQIMACRLFGAKPLSKPMLGYCQLNTQ